MPTLAISEGWNRNEPMRIQRCAPCVSRPVPMPGIRTSTSRMMEKISSIFATAR